MKVIQKLLPIALLLVAAVFLRPKLVSAIAGHLSTHYGVESSFDSKHYQVVPGSVDDGPSFRVRDGAKEITVKLCGVDAPEKEQSLGVASHKLLQKLIDKGDEHIVLVPIDIELQTDSMVAEAFVRLPDSQEELHLNSQLIAQGLASIDPSDISDCPNGSRIRQAEVEAKEQLRGLWANQTTELPD